MEVIQLVVSSVIFPYAASFTVEFYVSIFFVVDEFYKFNRFIGVYCFRRTKNLKILKKSQPSKKMPLKLLREIFRRFVSREKLDFFFPESKF